MYYSSIASLMWLKHFISFSCLGLNPLIGMEEKSRNQPPVSGQGMATKRQRSFNIYSNNKLSFKSHYLQTYKATCHWFSQWLDTKNLSEPPLTLRTSWFPLRWTAPAARAVPHIPPIVTVLSSAGAPAGALSKHHTFNKSQPSFLPCFEPGVENNLHTVLQKMRVWVWACVRERLRMCDCVPGCCAR
jgi:hypothetical protein